MTRRMLLILLGAAATLLALEVLLQLLPVSTTTQLGYYIDPHIRTYPARHRFTVSSGWDLRAPHRYRANNLGFLDTRDHLPDPHAIAVIGDSFVESNMLDPQARIGPQLEHDLHGRPVYSMGGPGSSLLDYAERMRYATQRLGIREFVLVISRSDVEEARCGSGEIHAVCIDGHGTEREWLQRAPSRAEHLLAYSALAQYLVSQLRVTPGRVEGWLKPSGAAPARYNLGEYRPLEPIHERIVARFLQRVALLAPHRVVFVFDCDRAPIYRGETPVELPSIALLRQRAMQNGYDVVRACDAFVQRYRDTGLHAEVSPSNGHWNAESHALIAARVAPFFRPDATAQ